MISVGALIAAGIAPTQARQFADPLSAACALYDINTPPRIAGFIAQARVESSGFTELEESLYYTPAERIRSIWPREVASLQQAATLTRNPKGLATVVYANKNGNGDAASGDGWTYRGRGIVQLTGRANYADAAAEIGRPYVDQPDLVAQPSDACLTAAWYWSTIKGNLLADASQWDAITKAVNGGMLQADARRQYSEEGIAAFA